MNAVLVTGASSGIGRATAELLLQGGARVALCGRRQALLAEVAAPFAERTAVIACDLGDPAQRDGLLERARNALGNLDGLVHAAGNVHHQHLGAIDDASLQQQLAVNLIATLRLCEQALETLEDGGSVVLLGSTLAHRPIDTSSVYSASKAAIVAMMKTVARRGAARGICVNAVSPGVVDTPMVRQARPDQQDVEQILAELSALHPLGRLGTPHDIAEAIRFLLSAKWMTGSELIIDGGLMLNN